MQRKLALMADDLDVLRRFEATTHAELVADAVALAAAERLVERVVMRAVDVNVHVVAARADGSPPAARPTYADSFRRMGDLGLLPTDLAASLARSAGMRNVLAHDYNDVDHVRLHAAIGTCLADYPRFIDELMRRLDLDADG